MQQLSISGLNAHFEKLLRKIPEERKALFVRLEPQMEAAVRRTVGGSGKVASWQVGALGSYGGYAAVHPRPKSTYEGYAVGYITNAVNSGHEKAGGKGWVPGKRFYEDAVPLAQDILSREVQNLEKRLKEVVEE